MLENVSLLLVGVSAIDSRGVSSSDGLHGVVGVLVLTGRDIIEVSRLIRDLVLRPSPGMVSGIVRLEPGEAIRDNVSAL